MKTFRDKLKSYGSAPALASVDDQLIGFDKLVLTADRLAMRMQDHGVGAGDRVIVMIDSWALRISFALAAVWLDADIILSTNPNLYLATGEALDYAIVLGDEQPAINNLRFDQSWLEGDVDFTPSGTGKSLLIASSSGSTGRPKVMGLSMLNMVAWVEMYQREFGMDSGPRLVTVASIGAGLMFVFKSLLEGQLAIGNRGDMAETMVRAKSYDVKELYVTPMILEDLCNYTANGGAVPDFENIGFGGAIAQLSVIRSTIKLFPKARVTVDYATTEVGGISYGIVDVDKPEGWVGFLGNDIEFSFDTFEDGEVLKIRLPESARLVGYFGGNPIYDDDGWFHTGDLMRQEPDGSYCFIGRVDHVINFGGVKVAPERIEAMLSRELGLTNCAISLSDGKTSVIVCHVSANDKPDGQKISDLIETYFRVDMPVHVVRVDILPRVESGKVDRQALRDYFLVDSLS